MVPRCLANFSSGYKNVSLIAPRVGARYFVEDHNSVLQVTVNIIQMEVGVDGLPPWTFFNQSVDGHGHLREGHPVLILCKDKKWMR